MGTMPAALTALIADDEPHLAQYLKKQLAQLCPELTIVATARNGSEAAAQIAALQPDLAFLDIQMPGLSGLEVTQGIEGETRVAFVTAYDGYALEAFEHAALDDALKPLKTERLAKTLERVRATLAAGEATPDAGLAGALQELLGAQPAPRLRYIRASGGRGGLLPQRRKKCTCVQTATAEYLLRTPITELVAQLEPQCFWQVHRSTIINLAHLAGTQRDELSRLYVRFRALQRELPVSRAYVHLFKSM